MKKFIAAYIGRLYRRVGRHAGSGLRLAEPDGRPAVSARVLGDLLRAAGISI
jgi:hypothetical protein